MLLSSTFVLLLVFLIIGEHGILDAFSLSGGRLPSFGRTTLMTRRTSVKIVHHTNTNKCSNSMACMVINTMGHIPPIECNVDEETADSNDNGASTNIMDHDDNHPITSATAAQQIKATTTPRKVVRPSLGVKGQSGEVEKFLMMYTCKICNERNMQMISKIAYAEGMVISTCKNCRNHHLIADNRQKLDFGTKFGNKIEEHLAQRGEKVQKLTISKDILKDYHLVDHNGQLSLVPKTASDDEIPENASIIEYPDNSVQKMDEKSLDQ